MEMIWMMLALIGQTGVAPEAATAEVTAPAAPAAAEALGLRLAETGTLAALLPVMEQQQTEELIAAHPELSAAEQQTLRETAAATAKADEAKLMAAMGHAYATRLSAADMQAMIAANTAPAAMRYRAALPQAIAAAMQGAGAIDFKAETMTAFCAKTEKGCAAK